MSDTPDPTPPASPAVAGSQQGDLYGWLQAIYRLIQSVQLEARQNSQHLTNLARKVDSLMALSQDLLDLAKKLDDECTAIGLVITNLVAKLQDASITPEEKQKVFDALNAVSARLTVLGSDPQNPVPPAPPPLVAAKKLAAVKP